MKASIPILFLILMTNLTAMGNTDPLECFQWKHRIILVTALVTDFDRMEKALKADEAAINERHIIWFIVAPEQLQTNYKASLPENFPAKITRRFFPKVGEGTGVCLIGKDGGVKARQTKLDLKELYARIDSMPMRQAEMRQNRERDD